MWNRSVKTALLVASNSELVGTIREMVNHQGPYAFDLSNVASIEDAEKHLANHVVDVVLLDFTLISATGFDAISRIHATAPRASSILLCGEEEEDAASELIESHVQDYLLKGHIQPQGLMRTMRNAIARKIVQELTVRDMDQAKLALNSIGDAVICTDEEGKISFLNPVAESMTGWSLKEVAGRPLTEALQIIDAKTGLAPAGPVVKAIRKDFPPKFPADCILVRQDGHQVYIEPSVAPIHDRDGKAVGYVLVFRDVTAARVLVAKIAHLAEHDALTGLPNRRLLNDRLGQAIATASRRRIPIAVLFLDLDGFKHINDSLGHRTGDKLLASVARRLQQSVRAPDSVSRQGGDEFIVLLTDVQRPKDAGVAARRILNAVEQIHQVAGLELRITASIGISIYPDDGLNAETLIKNADTAMYQAKVGGRRTFKFFTPEMNDATIERQAINEELHGALERGELTLHYQPRINLRSGAITGVEALLRWTEPRRGDVPPAKFIPVAEDSGLILPIGEWVLREACHQAKAWVDAALPVMTMAVNVSLVQFRDENFPNQLSEILSETGLNPELLEIEVTESTLMDHSEQTARLVRLLGQRGIRVTMEHFGTGYSSLSYLSKLPLNGLKIDQSFVQQMSAAPKHKAIVSAIISMAKSLSLRVIADGVETPEELAFLREKDCDEAQGYLFSRAVPPECLVRLIGH